MTKKKFYIERTRIENSSKGKYRYKYLVECRVCEKRYETKTYPSKQQPRCKNCAGRESYTPSKIERESIRKRGDGYITKQGYHLIYDGSKYIPAHRFAFPDLPSDMVVHHIDGDKLNNELVNLVPLSKKDHRVAHGELEKCSYYLIQNGLIQYDRENNTYDLSTTMKKFIDANPVNSGKLSARSGGDNPEPSPVKGRCNDYPLPEYARSLVEAQDT